MTKTTNLEISKKLAEIGFKDSYIYAWYIDEDGGEWLQEIKHVKPFLINKYGDKAKVSFVAPAYGFEAIWDALPDKTEIIINQLTNKREFYLDYGLRGSEIFVEIKENESLVDTAGTMIILLHEKNLIKF
jgi:hypothetical protein